MSVQHANNLVKVTPRRKYVHRKRVILIGPLLEALGKLLIELLNPSNITFITIVGGVLWRSFKKFRDILEKQQNEMILAIDKRLSELETTNKESHSDLEREILRLQILNGIDSERLSVSEVLYFYDKYKKAGGNSFVEDKVEAYIKYLSPHVRESLKGGTIDDIKRIY